MGLLHFIRAHRAKDAAEKLSAWDGSPAKTADLSERDVMDLIAELSRILADISEEKSLLGAQAQSTLQHNWQMVRDLITRANFFLERKREFIRHRA